MDIFKVKRTAVLVSAFAVSLGAVASDGTWQKPGIGSFYLYNEARGQFLAVGGDGRLQLSDRGEQLALGEADKATGSYTLASTRGRIHTTFDGGVSVGAVDADGIQEQWMFKPVEGKTNVYTLCCRDNTASAASYIYYSALTDGVAKTYTEPSASGQWKLMGVDDQMQVLTIDEAADTYAKPELADGVTSALVHLRRTFTIGSWNSLCLPFAVGGEQLKEQFGDDVQLVAFSKYENNTLVCEEVNDLSVEAGKPYLVCPTANPADGRDFYEFAGVTSFVASPSATESNGVSFTGSFAKTTAPVGAVVLRRNEVYTLGHEQSMKGTRAYFAQTATSAMAAPIMFWSIGSTPTSIDKVFVGGRAVDIYNVNGVLVRSQATSAKGLPKGVYVVEGQKFTVR